MRKNTFTNNGFVHQYPKLDNEQDNPLKFGST